MEQKQILVIDWWYSGKDYQTGLMLLSQFCKNKTIILTLTRKAPKYGAGKLAYELTKSVRLNYLKMPEQTEESRQLQLQNKQSPVSKTIQNIAQTVVDTVTQYPSVVRRMKHEYSELYNKRSIAHKKMALVADVNSTKNNAERSGYLKEINTDSLRMDFLYKYIKDYEDNKVVPPEDEIWKKPKLSIKEITSVPELKKRRTGLLKLVHKNNNVLLYQQRKKGKEENPLPDGPKRVEMIALVKKQETEISEIEARIEELGKNAH